MWSYVLATIALISSLAGVFYGGVRYGDLRTQAAYQQQAIDQRDQVNADLRQQLAAEDADDGQATANFLQIQTDLEAIRRSSGSVGAQLRSALDASNLATCVLDPDVQRLRAESYQAASAAVDAANRARDPH